MHFPIRALVCDSQRALGDSVGAGASPCLCEEAEKVRTEEWVARWKALERGDGWKVRGRGGIFICREEEEDETIERGEVEQRLEFWKVI